MSRPSKRTFLERLSDGTVIGAEGYVFELERRGYIKAGPYVPEVILDEPDALRQLHREFLRAGADVMVALTYYAHRKKLKDVGREGQLEELNRQAVRIANEIAAEGGALVAGNICNTWSYDPADPKRSGEVVCEQYTQNWDPTLAQAFAEDCLTKTGGDVDVFLGMNDGTTGGSVVALISQGYQPGEKLVTGGQDATVEALRYIAQGWQDNSVLKDLKLEANYAADVVASILAGKGVPKEVINGKVNNKFMDVPAVFLPVTNITADNLGDVVKVGMWTWPQICQGGAQNAPACKAAASK